MRWTGGLFALLFLLGCTDTHPTTASAPPTDLLAISVPGSDTGILARLCRPAGAGPAPLAVINHGSPANPSERPGMAPQPCAGEAVRWFTGRGFAVLLPLRRGYGASGGGWAEGYGRCDNPDFAAAGRESARDIAAAVAFGTRQPGIRADRVLVVGQSAGGWGSLALSAANTPPIAAIVNMAGGRGGWAQGSPNTNCRPDRLAAAAGEYGRTARLPTLWVFTANDTFFGPPIPTEMHRAYTAAGGNARLAQLPAWGRDGHSLFFGRDGSATWGPVVEPFLRANGF